MKTAKSIPIYFFDINYNLIHEFDSKNEALQFLGVSKSRLEQAIKNDLATCRGFLIKKSKGYYNDQTLINPAAIYYKKPIATERVLTYKDYLKQGVKTKQFTKTEATESYRSSRNNYQFKCNAFS